MDLDPDFVVLVVVLAEPGVKTGGLLEGADFTGVDFDGGHRRIFVRARATA